jgi:hypothetical protein
VVPLTTTPKDDNTQPVVNEEEILISPAKKLLPPANKVKFNTFIIQKYIERPLLIHKRKFDIRVWVLLTHEHDLYFFPEGYLRTSGSEFNIDLNNVDDAFVHLTNNAV